MQRIAMFLAILGVERQTKHGRFANSIRAFQGISSSARVTSPKRQRGPAPRQQGACSAIKIGPIQQSLSGFASSEL